MRPTVAGTRGVSKGKGGRPGTIEYRSPDTPHSRLQVAHGGDVFPGATVDAQSEGEEPGDGYPGPKTGGNGGGHADDYGHFLVDEVKPFIDANYLTDTRPASTTVAGSSMGGLVSLFLAFQYPHVFGMAGALSPSLWWASGDLAARIAADRRPGPTKIWLDMGTAEGSSDTISPRPLGPDGKFGRPGPANGVKDVLDYTREMRQALLFRGYEEGRSLLYLEVPGGTHTEESWSARIGIFLKALYGRDGGHD